jgi:hypothetical protein
MKKLQVLLLLLQIGVIMFAPSCTLSAQDITIINNKKSDYVIVIPAEPLPAEDKAANIMQGYVFKASGVQLPILRGTEQPKSPAIYIGRTQKGNKVFSAKLSPEGYLIQTDKKDIIIKGGSGKGVVYGVTTFLEQYGGFKKLSNAVEVLPALTKWTIPSIKLEHKQAFEYRETYYPASMDAEYLEWHQLHRFEDLWGLWGHTYNKLLPAKTYFIDHPEYYALVKGKRTPTQLCLSNKQVYNIIVDELRKRIADNPDALYWSISPNDDIGWCTCPDCKKTDDEQDSPAGSLIKFVNAVAQEFPNIKITTLAYGYTHRAPKTLKPADNVYVFLSNIDAYRDKPLSDEGTAAGFRADLKAWSAITPNLFIWDYTTQFTNYLAPFPNFGTLQANIQYLKSNGVKGIFAQGSGATYSEFAELRSYLQAKLMVDAQANVKKLMADFTNEYYGTKAGPIILDYLNKLQANMQATSKKLDIYGNPINEWNGYLSPDYLDLYSALFDKAEAAVEGNPKFMDRVMRARLPLEYTVLQQARHYGIEKFGIFVQEGNKWTVKPRLAEKVKKFVANCKRAGVTELSEDGLSPDQYLIEWEGIFKSGVTPSKAVGGTVSLVASFAMDYPAKGYRTLVDGNPGYKDFSYNWLCFYGVPMEATIELPTTIEVKTVKMHFLDDPRHWIFEPQKVTVSLSVDGEKYTQLPAISKGAADEHYEVSLKDFVFLTKSGKQKARFIKVVAENGANLPVWRFKEGKKPMIACDEIFVQ